MAAINPPPRLTICGPAVASGAAPAGAAGSIYDPAAYHTPRQRFEAILGGPLHPGQVEYIERRARAARAASTRTIGRGITPRPALVAMLSKAERGMGDGRAIETARFNAGLAARGFLLRRKALAPGIAPVLAPITRAVREAGRR